MKTEEEWENEGIAFMEKEQYQEALTCFDAVLAQNPQNLKIWFVKGFALASMQQFLEAVNCFDRVLKTNPENRSTLRNKGKCLSFLNRYEEAIRCYDKVIKLDAADGEAWAEKGMNLSILKQFEAAIECFDRALGLDPGNDEIKQIEEEIKQRPNDNEPWKRKGLLLLKMEDEKKLKAAVDCFDKAIKLDAIDYESFIYKGQTLYFSEIRLVFFTEKGFFRLVFLTKICYLCLIG
jgi:tetratricopeptide (TPR) repeat protein